MNKGDFKRLQKLGERKLQFKSTPIKIYIVKLKEIHYRAESKSTTNNTYNLYAYEDLNTAHNYLNSVYDDVIDIYEKRYAFKKLMDSESSKTQIEGNNKILYERTVRMVGINEYNISQTKLIKLFIEEINLGIGVAN